MNDPARIQAADPATAPATLARLAYEHPELRATIAANPSAYPELLTWLQASGDPAVDAAIARRGAAPTAPAAPPVGGHGSWAPQGAQQAAPQGQPAWAPQATSQAAWGPQPGASVNPGLGSQGAGSYTFAGGAGGFGAPAVSAYDSGEPRRSRRGLVIGGAVAAGVVVLGGGAWAAKTLIFDKLGGAETPEAAVVQLVEGAADKDFVAVYGALSPAEVSGVKTQLDSLLAKSADVKGLGSYETQLKDIVDGLDVQLTGLEVRSEPITDGVSKVYLSQGQLTVDGDVQKIADAFVDATYEAVQSGGAMDLLQGGLGGSPADMLPDKETLRAEMVTQLDEALPATVSAADLRTEEFGEAFLVAVEEDGAWFVSPYLTLGEYALVASDGTRGTLPAATAIKSFGSATEAAAGLVDGIVSYARTGNPHDVAVTLPLAERRLAALYLPTFEGLGDDMAGFEIRSNTFGERSADGSTARVVPKGFELYYTQDGQELSAVFDGPCMTLKVTAMGEGKVCTDQAPLIKELGMQDLSVVAVQEDGTWFASPTATMADAMGILGERSIALVKDGRLDDEAWMASEAEALQSYLMDQPLFASMFGMFTPDYSDYAEGGGETSVPGLDQSQDQAQQSQDLDLGQLDELPLGDELTDEELQRQMEELLSGASS